MFVEMIMKGIGQELSVQNVSKYYGSFKALTDINLVCKPGEFVSILGSSGSGKTTLLKVIAGFERCSDGKIFINGKDVANVPCFKRNIGMLNTRRKIQNTDAGNCRRLNATYPQ